MWSIVQVSLYICGVSNMYPIKYFLKIKIINSDTSWVRIREYPWSIGIRYEYVSILEYPGFIGDEFCSIFYLWLWKYAVFLSPSKWHFTLDFSNQKTSSIFKTLFNSPWAFFSCFTSKSVWPFIWIWFCISCRFFSAYLTMLWTLPKTDLFLSFRFSFKICNFLLKTSIGYPTTVVFQEFATFFLQSSWRLRIFMNLNWDVSLWSLTRNSNKRGWWSDLYLMRVEQVTVLRISIQLWVHMHISNLLSV